MLSKGFTVDRFQSVLMQTSLGQQMSRSEGLPPITVIQTTYLKMGVFAASHDALRMEFGRMWETVTVHKSTSKNKVNPNYSGKHFLKCCRFSGFSYEV